MEIVYIIIGFFVVILISGFSQYKRKNDFDDDAGVDFSDPDGLTDEEKAAKIKQRLHKNIGSKKLICPHCGAKLTKWPIKFTTCRKCGTQVQSVVRPYDDERVIVYGKDLDIIKKDQQDKTNMSLSGFFTAEKQLLQERNLQHIPSSVVVEFILQQRIEKYIDNESYKNLHFTIIQLAIFYYKQKNYKQALIEFLNAMYIDANVMTDHGFKRVPYNIWKQMAEKPRLNPFRFINKYKLVGICIVKLELSLGDTTRLFREAEFYDLPYWVSRPECNHLIGWAYSEFVDAYRAGKITKLMDEADE